MGEKYGSCFDTQTTEVELPDGSVQNIESSLLNRCTDSLFNSHHSRSLPDMVYEGIMATSIHSRKHVFANVIISGGNTMLSGFPEQLKNRLDEIVSKRHKGLEVRVVAPPERLYS